MSDLQPGWHADPAGAEAVLRWWDGEQWTRWLSSDAAAPDPTRPPPVEPVETASVGTAPAAAEESLVRLPVAVAVVLAAVLVAVVAVGAVASASTRGLPSGPALAPPSPTAPLTSAAPLLDYDAGSRATTIGKLRVTLPGAPYACPDAAAAARPAFDLVVACNAPVHAYGHGEMWSATAGAGLLPTSLVVAGDAHATADRAFSTLRREFFRATPTTVTTLRADPTDLAPAGQAVVVSGQVHYRVRGVASRYDRLLVVVVALPDDRYAIVFSSRPNDSARTVLTALDASLATVTTK